MSVEPGSDERVYVLRLIQELWRLGRLLASRQKADKSGLEK